MVDCSTPMTLCLDGQVVGQIVDYGYETPWASGRFVAAEGVPWLDWVEACELSQEIESWPELPPEAFAQDQQRWAEALARRGLQEHSLMGFQQGAWSIYCNDGSEQPLAAMPDFDRQGFVTWRW